DLFRDHFAEREAMGDAPAFSLPLDIAPPADPGGAAALLQKIDHPFAVRLLGQLREWQRGRIDRQFPAAFRRLLASEDDEERLLVEPDSWRELLDQAQSAVLHEPPRSVLTTGEARIGKTAFLRLLCARLRQEGWTIFEAGGPELQAGQIYIGQLEGRIRQLVEELHVRKRVAWYAHDLLQLAESGTHRGQSASILDQILPAIAAGSLVLL